MLLMSIMKGLVLGTAALAATELLNAPNQPGYVAPPDWIGRSEPWFLLSASVALAVTSLFSTVVGLAVTRFTTSLWDLLLILLTGGVEMLLCFTASKPPLWGLWAFIAAAGVTGHAVKVWSVLRRSPIGAFSSDAQLLGKAYRSHLKEACLIMVGYVFVSLLVLRLFGVLATGVFATIVFVIGMFRIEAMRGRLVVMAERSGAWPG